MERKRIRLVIVPSAKALIKMKEHVDDANVNYKLGKSAGKDFFEYFIKDEGMKDKTKKIFEVLNSTGYGNFELKRISKEAIIVKITRSPLTEVCSKDKKIFCHWIKGLLTGLFNNLGNEWLFEHRKCNTLHSFCEFRGKLIR